jgi:hypothetical protein
VNVSEFRYWSSVTDCFLVNRVHWLRARAQRQRWKEELILVGYEMIWTVNYFKHQCQQWSDRKAAANVVNNSGAAAYASRKMAMWTCMASNADNKFQKVNSAYKLCTK